MFSSCEKSTGTTYTPTVALLAMAFVFSPGMLIASHQFGHLSVSLAVVCSATCLILAGVVWKKSSRLSIPSLAIQRTESK